MATFGRAQQYLIRIPAAPAAAGGGNSTGRLVKISGQDGTATGDSTGRIVQISGSDQNPPAATVAIDGPAELEAGQPFTLTPVVSGGVATSYTWLQTGGPTVQNTALDTFRGIAPAGRSETTIAFEVTVNPGGATDTHTITVHGASYLLLINGEWTVPPARYDLTGA